MGHILRELGFALKLRRAADRGEPAVLIIRADHTLDITFPQKMRGNIVYYVDPRTRRQEIVIVRPEALLHLGKAILIPHLQGAMETLGWRELASLFFAHPSTVQTLRKNMLDLLERYKDSIPNYEEYRERVEKGTVVELADVWREWRAAGIINNIPPPDPPAFLSIPARVLETFEDLRTAVLAESMAYVKQVTGLQGLLGGRGSWWWIILLVLGGLVLLWLLGGVFHPPAAHPTPIKT